ncbi:UDP-glycosyltransferase UGT5-like [Drosophila gunungcola]|uniref:UDP-glycosyltransferase UGT5-like n=1 Tax=Drosophila gunungcola TaxID=103775 RepID=UPI0022E11685|nr:UDP-glycosyltransferase UGT5-like [Drosophila gunungcola]
MINPIIRKLVRQGHEVTFITPYSLSKENLGSNYKEIVIPQYDFWPEIKELANTNSVIEMTKVSSYTYLQMLHVMGISNTDFVFDQPEVRDLFNANEKVGQYDLLLAGQFYNEGALILGHLFQIPIVTVSTFGFTNYYSQLAGIVSPWSYVPHGFMPYTEHMSLWDRIGNVAISGFEDLYREFSYYPKQNAILKKHFAKLLDRVPTIKELERNISAMLLNTYMPLASARPVSYNMILVGGLHIEPPKALPEHLQKFLDGAEHGVIYFSLGSQVRSADMPPQKLKIFLDVFGRLKQRILWKFEDETPPNMPTNVMVQKWLPQQDILSHPNVKVFIAHGGLFGTQEAVYNAVPILGLPVYCDQHLNINQGKKAGYALGLDYQTLNAVELRESLLELIENPKYRNKMKEVSRIFRDRPLNAMDTAMYWINYVIEHRGAPHLVAAGVELPWYQFYLLDILGLGIVLIITLAWSLMCIKRKFKSIYSSMKKVKKN